MKTLLRLACNRSGVYTLQLLSCLLLTASLSIRASADEWDTLRGKWTELMVGNASNTTYPEIVTQIGVMTATAQGHWDSLNKSPSRTYLWSDVSLQYPNQNITTSYERLREMARAYSTPGSSLAGNPALLADTIAALDWLNANWYDSTTPYGTQSADNNWFAWEIGAPWALEDAMAMLYPSLSSTQITNYTNAIIHWCVTPTDIGTSMNARWGITGANRAWKSLVWAQLGILTKSSATITQARTNISPNFLYTQYGDGFYPDGSFIQHTAFAYTSGYGFGHLGATVDLMYLLDGSSWAISDSNKANAEKWVYDSFEPNIFRNRIYDHLNGRTITRGAAADNASSLLMMSWKLAQLPGNDSTRLRALIKQMIQSDSSFDWTKIGPFSVQSLKGVTNSGTVAARGEVSRFKVFPQMDRFSLLRPTYAFSAGMYSSATFNYEAINNENLMGWNTNDGRTILYTVDTNQFGDNWWATVDKYRLPGVTVTSRNPANIDSPQVGAISVIAGSTTITDSMGNWSTAWDHSPGWNFSSGSLGGDASRIVRTFDTIESMTYNLTGMTSFSATLFARDSKPLAGRVQAFVSPDAKNWAACAVSLGTPASIGGGWSSLNAFPAVALPAGTSYVRLEFLMNDSLPSQLSDKVWVGGTSLAETWGQTDIYGAAGLELHPPGETLTAKKSWFFFDDEIVALGSGIRATEGVPIESVIESRKLNAAGNNPLVVNGTTKSASLGWTETMSGVNWINLAGNVAGSDIGYFFPSPTAVKGVREARSGSLLDMAHSTSTPATTYTRNFLTLWMDHGIDPGTTSAVGSYSYVLLPGKTSVQTSAYAASPDITVLENSEDAQGVKENTLNLTAVNFWRDQIRKTGIIQANRPASIVVREKPGQELDVSLSDPTQENNGTIDVEIAKAATTGYERDPGIFVYQTSPTIRFTAKVAGKLGSTMRARFNLSGTPWSIPPRDTDSTAPTVAFVDDLNDWLKAFASNPEIIFDTAVGANMENDPSRARRKTTDTPQAIVWKIDRPLTLGFKVYYRNGITGKIAAYRSADNITWAPITLTTDAPVATAGSWYRVNFTASPRLPFDTQYVKIELANDALVYSPQLSQVSANTATIPTVLNDELDDFTKVQAQTSGWQLDSSSQAYFAGDLSRLKRSSDTPQSVTYAQSNMVSFSAKVYFYGSVDGKVTAETSTTGSLWSPLTVTHNAPQTTSNGWYVTTFYPSTAIPVGTGYLRLSVANDTRVYTPQVGKVAIELGEFTDSLAHWGYVFERTSGWATDSTNPSYFDGDSSRIKRTADTAQSLVYAYPDAVTFSATIFAVGDFNNKVAAYASADGVNWSTVPVTLTSPVATGGSWLKSSASPVSALPTGTNYVKLELKNDTRIYAPQLGTVWLRRE